jgi:hypothetical protein
MEARVHCQWHSLILRRSVDSIFIMLPVFVWQWKIMSCLHRTLFRKVVHTAVGLYLPPMLLNIFPLDMCLHFLFVLLLCPMVLFLLHVTFHVPLLNANIGPIGLHTSPPPSWSPLSYIRATFSMLGLLFYPEDGGSTFLWSISSNLPDCKVPHPRRQYSSQLFMDTPRICAKWYRGPRLLVS